MVTKNNDPKDKIDGELYTTRFFRGVKKAYDKRLIASVDDNFGGKGKVFYTKIVIHMARKERYNPEQRFVQLRIGGETPTLLFDDSVTYNFAYEDANHWFHSSVCANYKDSDTEEYSYIHMPTIGQLQGDEKLVCKETSNYETASAHELGHILGLGDAYTNSYLSVEDGITYKITYDRLAENAETCLRIPNGSSPLYYNMMYDAFCYSKVRANDIEMMLEAYANSENGTPIYDEQYFNVYHDGNRAYDFSRVIMNRRDGNMENSKERL